MKGELYRYEDRSPTLQEPESLFIAPGAQIMGAVTLAPGSSVWFQAVLRGDTEPIHIGAGTNIQDGCVAHSDPGFPVEVGKDCTVGHMALLHGCKIGDGTLIGMGARLLNGAVIGSGSLVGAGALVTEGKTFPAGALILGMPARMVRELTHEERAELVMAARRYREKAIRYRKSFVAVH